MLVVVISALLVATLPSVAQERYFAQAGTIELAGNIALSSITPVYSGRSADAMTLFSFGPEVSYFFTDGFEVGFTPGVTLLPAISTITPPEGDGATILQLFGAPAYNFILESRAMFPFVSTPLGYTSLSEEDNKLSGFSWGIKGGVKFVATDHLLLTVYGEYLAMNFTPENDTERKGFNFLSFGVSAGGFFPTKD